MKMSLVKAFVGLKPELSDGRHRIEGSSTGVAALTRL